jgi:signal transduction histidine kinase
MKKIKIWRYKNKAQGEPMLFKNLGIALKIRMLLFSMLALGGITFGLIYYYHSLGEDDAKVINIAGRQRMLSQEMTKLANSIAAGHEDDREALGEVIAEYNSSLWVLIRGGSAMGYEVPPAPDSVLPSLNRNLELWREFQDCALVVHRSPRSNPDFIEALEFIEGTNEMLLTGAVSVIDAYSALPDREEYAFEIEAAGRLRMLSQIMTKHAYAISRGDASARTKLGDAEKVYDNIITSLIHGGTVEKSFAGVGGVVKPAPGNVREKLLLLDDTWRSFKTRAAVVKHESYINGEFERALSCINANNLELRDASNEVVQGLTLVANERVMRMKQLLVALVALGFTAFIIGYVFAERGITRPILELSKVTRDMSSGNLNARARVRGMDEIGELASSFNEMAAKLKLSYDELEHTVDERTKELLLLQKVNNLLNSGSRLEVILETIANGLTSVFGYDISAIHLLNERKTHLICKSYSADSGLVRKVEQLIGKRALNYRIPLFKGSMLTRLIETKEPIITEDIVTLVKSHSDSPVLQPLARPIAKLSGIKFGLGVPLLAEDKIVGVIGIGSRKKLSEKDVDRLLNFAEQAGLAVERAKIYEILEDKVQERTRELEESKEFLDSVFNSITDIIFIRDLNYKIIKANKVAAQVFGRDLAGKCCYSTFMYKSGPCADCPVERTMVTGKAITREVFNKNLKEHLLISTYPIVGEGGELKGVVESIKVITEKKKMEEQMMQSEKLASIGRLAAGFAHEINNPLTNISLYAQILQERVRGENRKMLGIIRNQTDVAARIVKNLLEFTYHHPENYVPTQLNEILTKALDFLEPQFRQANVDVYLELDPELSRIRGDESQLQQVFVNIFTNAVDAMSEGGVLRVGTLNNGDYVEARISDTGCGIPEENLSKIFDPFFTTKEVGEGTGLGLFISYGIIQKHDGLIRVKSEVGKGTTFNIQLPRLKEP